MTKQKKTKITKGEPQGFFATFQLSNLIADKYHALVAIAIVLILFLIFLNPLYFGDKSFQSGDIVASEAMKPYLEKDRDGFSLWNPYIFFGMPSYAIATETPWFNLIAVIITQVRNVFTAFFSNDYAKWSFYLILLGITTFFYMRDLTKNTLVSLFTGVATAFSTGLIVFLFIGHVTKLTSLCMYPILFMMLFRFQRQIKLLDFLILAFVMQLLIQGFHVQIIFYTLFAVGIYYGYFIIRSITKKLVEERKQLFKSIAAFSGAVAIALLIQADSFSQIYEYTDYSTRGTKSITELSATTSPEKSESEYYEYHTGWSFSPEEVMTFIVPSFYGFGKTVYKGELSNNQEVEVNTYFGQMPFVDVAMYMGVIVFFLALFAVATRWKEPIVQFLTILSALALIISFGKNFPMLFDLLFYYLPYFDKFRVPSMILVLVQMTLPILAGFGLMKIISLKNEHDNRAKNILKYSAFAFTGLFVLSLLLASPITDWFATRVKDYAGSIASNQNLSQQFQALAPFISEMFHGDLLVAMFLCTAAFWLGNFYVNKKISADFFVVLIVALTLFDLWRINTRGASYVDKPDTDATFVQPDYITFIKEQKNDLPFRMLNLKQDRSLGSFSNNSDFHAYFLVEDFHGYSAIKPRAYQDFMDVIGPFNETLWKLGNVRYLVFEKPIAVPGLTNIFTSDKSTVYEFNNYHPRVFFVDAVEKKNNLNALNEIKANTFEPKAKAFVHDENLQVEKTDSTASVSIKNNFEDRITVEVNASGNNFLFFSTTYQPKGWKATIDGAETKIHRTNHAFMGIVVPKGKHTIEFYYLPDSWVLSKYISLVLSTFVVGGILILLVMKNFKRKEKSAQV